MNIITHQLLRDWQACEAGYKRFCELFPNGADLKTAIDGLVEAGHDSWGFWLFDNCKRQGIFKDVTDKGYGNAGSENAGSWNAGSRNAGSRNAGSRNAGSRNAGSWNAGSWNAGSENAGSWNAGSGNAGSWNAGSGNAGSRNAGSGNAGSRNAGSWNKANYQTGYFNTTTPEDVLVFNQLCSREAWEGCKKPNFIFNAMPNIWINESEMSDDEKVANPKFYVAGGYLKSIPMEAAWKDAWDKASPEDRELIKHLPNFNAEIFKEISGIDVI